MGRSVAPQRIHSPFCTLLTPGLPPHKPFPRLHNTALIIHRDAHSFKQNSKLPPPSSPPTLFFRLTRWRTSSLSSNSFCHPPLLVSLHLYQLPFSIPLSTSYPCFKIQLCYFLQEALIDTPRGNQRYTCSSDSPGHYIFIIVLIKVHVIMSIHSISYETER